MHFGKLIIGLALAVATAAHAGSLAPHYDKIVGCVDKTAAQAIAEVAHEGDPDASMQLLSFLSDMGFCGTYTGLFVIDDVSDLGGPLLVLKVTTLESGIIYRLYYGPRPDGTTDV